MLVYTNLGIWTLLLAFTCLCKVVCDGKLFRWVFSLE